MQQHIIVSETLRIKSVVKWVLGYVTAVNGYGYAPAVYRVIISHIITHPAFNTPLFVTVGTQTLAVKVTPDFAAIYEKITDIISGLAEIFDKL
jgi:hypothetical protein